MSVNISDAGDLVFVLLKPGWPSGHPYSSYLGKADQGCVRVTFPNQVTLSLSLIDTFFAFTAKTLKLMRQLRDAYVVTCIFKKVPKC